MQRLATKKTLFSLLLAQCLLTITHHLYGEFILYQDGVRLHAVMVAPMLLLLTFAPLRLHPGPVGWRLFTVWTLLIWVIGLGLFEGFWNHVVVDLLAIFDLGDTFSFAFIRSIPGDFLFELTGITQFAFAVGIVVCISRLSSRPAF